MVRRVYEAKGCLKYKEGILSSYPMIKLRIYNILGMKFPEELEVPVDTGYEGSLMLRSDDYEFFCNW